MIPLTTLEIISARSFGFFVLEILKLLFFYSFFLQCHSANLTLKIVKAIFDLRAEEKTWTDIGLVFEQEE